MGELEFMTDEEKRQFADLSDKLRGLTEDFLSKEDFDAVTDMVATAGEHSQALKECFGLNEKIFDLQTAIITAEEIGMGRAAILSILPRHAKFPPCAAFSNGSTAAASWTIPPSASSAAPGAPKCFPKRLTSTTPSKFWKRWKNWRPKSGRGLEMSPF